MKKIFAAWALAAVLFAPSLAVIASDLFTDTNGTRLNAHTMTAGGLSWAEESTCEFEVQSNKAVWKTSVGWCLATIEASDASVSVEADIAVPNATDYAVGLNVRFVDSNNNWRAQIDRRSSGTPELIIVEVTGGGETNRDTDALGAVSGTTVNLKVTTSGDVINAYLDDVLTSTYTSASHNTATKHGLAIYSGFDTTPTWDAFVLDSDPGGGGATINPAPINNPIRGGGWFVRRR
jgi:hypothetical protein